MIKFIEKETPEIKYPVARRAKSDGLVVIFWRERLGTVIYAGTSPLCVGSTEEVYKSCMHGGVWEPVDVEITDEIRIGESTEDGITYPVARKRKDNDMIVLFFPGNRGVVANVGTNEGTNIRIGDSFVFTDVTDNKWEPVDLKIYG
jgi:hypothetical protein